MGERTRIGFYYVWDSSWMGGVLYAQNLLKALNTLDDEDKPFIDVYCRSESSYGDLKAKTNYPYMGIIVINDNLLIKRVLWKLSGIFFGERFKAKLDRFKVLSEDCMIFPYFWGRNVDKCVYWHPDFQDKHLPSLFSHKEIKARENIIRMVVERNIPIWFSSYDAESDFKRFYPNCTNRTFVVHFAVSHNDFSHVSIEEIKKKYGITGEYLLCSNQFWKHKNHLFLFKAYQKALQKGLSLQLVCTGKLYDYRNPEYIREVKDFIAASSNNKIVLTGMIDSEELHCLMKNSYAVIQPSLFEGWNTTVEDCKALNKFIFLSDLPVHREQANENVCFFNPRNEDDLVTKLITIKPEVIPCDYSNNLREFGECFLELINYMKNKK